MKKYVILFLIAIIIPITNVKAAEKTISQWESELKKAQAELDETNSKKQQTQNEINNANNKINSTYKEVLCTGKISRKIKILSYLYSKESFHSKAFSLKALFFNANFSI